jgi:hypothetical protein
MNHIKKVNEMIDQETNNRFWNKVVNMGLRMHFGNNDEKNATMVAAVLSAITSEWSNYAEDHEEAMDSDTQALMYKLDNLSSKLRGDWDEQICF